MPVWGNRMVCETANYKHIEEKKKEFLERENTLGRWVKEKAERKRRLSRLNERIRQGSICSTNSQQDKNGDDTMTGSVDLDSNDEDAFPSPTVTAAPPLPTPTTIKQPRRNSAPSAPGAATTNSRPSSASGLRSGSLGSSFDSGDRAHMVGEGREWEHPCGQCSIQ